MSSIGNHKIADLYSQFSCFALSLCPKSKTLEGVGSWSSALSVHLRASLCGQPLSGSPTTNIHLPEQMKSRCYICAHVCMFVHVDVVGQKETRVWRSHAH